MQEIKVKENKTNRIIFIDDLPSIDKFAPEVVDAFVKSYEQAIFSMFAHKRSKKLEKQISDK